MLVISRLGPLHSHSIYIAQFYIFVTRKETGTVASAVTIIMPPSDRWTVQPIVRGVANIGLRTINEKVPKNEDEDL